jgi:hypothetical protein
MDNEANMCEYRFSDCTKTTKKYCYDQAFVLPKDARKYSIAFFEIVKAIISDSYVILDCEASFVDYDGYCFDRMPLFKDGAFLEEEIAAWEKKYCSGDGIVRPRQLLDLICHGGSLVMHLKHIEGTPFLVSTSNYVVGRGGKKKKGKTVKDCHRLEHNTVAVFNSDGELVPISKKSWSNSPTIIPVPLWDYWSE